MSKQFTPAEVAEIERRRNFLGCGRQLSDEQLLQIKDPCPEDYPRKNKAVRKGPSTLFNARDNEGKTPAHHAAENGHADSLRVIHNGGGDLSEVDDAGCMPSHYAVCPLDFLYQAHLLARAWNRALQRLFMT